MVESLDTGSQHEILQNNTMYCNYIVRYNTRYSKTLDSSVKCMNGTESRAQHFGLYHYQGGFLNHIPSSSPSPSLTYSCIAGEKVRKVRSELHFSTVEYLIPLEEWAVGSNTVTTEGD